jgi:UDP-N-acetylglucosamine 2-epimerase (non-hydrolysing)
VHKILTILGTRPEVIKLSPVVKELSKHPQKLKSVIGVTGQNDELLKQVLNLFKIKPEFNLMVMQKNRR